MDHFSGRSRDSRQLQRRPRQRRGRSVTIAVIVFSLMASACTVGSNDTVVQTAEAPSVETEVAGVTAEREDEGAPAQDDGGSSALGFRMNAAPEASLSSAQLGFELEDPSAEATDAAEGAAVDATADEGEEVALSEWVPADDGDDEAESATTSGAYAGPLADIPPGPGAEPLWVATAKSSTGYVQLYDAPNGTPISVDYHYLDGSTLEYQVWNPTFFGGPLSLLVVGGDPENDDYVQVELPVRPTGTTAWVAADQFEYFLNDYYVEIDVATNTVRAWQDTELLLETSAVTGRPDRPTPLLRTYIDEKLPGPNSAYGPWMLTLAAFSESLNTFGAGLPKLAVHGTNQPELMGQYASSGCIRLPNDVINQLAELVPVGTRVDIIRS